jgi:hypothetical protein
MEGHRHFEFPHRRMWICGESQFRKSCARISGAVGLAPTPAAMCVPPSDAARKNLHYSSDAMAARLIFLNRLRNCAFDEGDRAARQSTMA